MTEMWSGGTGFQNAPIDQNGRLVVPALQSPNFAPGVEGWRIGKDGSAEFNDVVMRGELDVEGSDGSYVRALAQGGHADVMLQPQTVPGFTWTPALLTADVDPGNVSVDIPALTIRSPGGSGLIEPPAEIFMLGPGELDQNAIHLRANSVQITQGTSPTPVNVNIDGTLFAKDTTIDGVLDAGNIEGGIESISFTARTSFVFDVNFTKTFTAPPVMSCNIASGSGTVARWASRAINVTSTGFQIFVFLMESAAPGTAWSNVPVHWLAMGV